MKNKLQLKYVFWAVVVVAVAFIVWEIVKAIRSTEQTASDIAAAPGKILMAPFTALSSAWAAIKSFFTPSKSSPSTSVPSDVPLPPTSPFNGYNQTLWGYLNQP